MENYYHEISGWLNASGDNIVGNQPSGFRLYRIVSVEPQCYETGRVSTAGGSFKPSGDRANWYGDGLHVSEAEDRPTGTHIREFSRLKQDTPVWNMHKLPEQFRTAIYNDRGLVSGKFEKSQFVIECLQTAASSSGVSGVYFPSRRAEGGVIVLNPHAVGIEIVYTGQAPPPAD